MRSGQRVIDRFLIKLLFIANDQVVLLCRTMATDLQIGDNILPSKYPDLLCPPLIIGLLAR